MSNPSLRCFHCKKEVEIPALQGVARVGLRDTCPHCSTDLHVCLNCVFYDEGAHHECRETQAEWVAKKDRSNRCDYFRPASASGANQGPSKADQLSVLDALFKK